MNIKIYDTENVAKSIDVDINDVGYFICPHCKEGQVPLQPYHYQTNDPSKYTYKGICPCCQREFYKAL